MTIPGWLAEVVKTQRVPVPWPDMARAALAIALPLAAGLAAGQATTGLLLGIGGLLGSAVDRGGPYPMRVRRITCAALCGGVPGLVLGGLIHGHGWLAVGVLVLVAGASAVMSAVGDIASVTGLQLLVYTSFGMGPLGAVHPWWKVPALFLAGVAWSVVLLLPGWLRSPGSATDALVAGVYQALAGKLRAIGTAGYPQARRAVTDAANAAYDEVLSARAAASGREQRLVRLVALLGQAHQIAEAASALAVAGERPPPEVIAAVEALADAIGRHGPVPGTGEPPPSASSGMLTLREGIAGAADLLAGRREPPGTQPGIQPGTQPVGVPGRRDLVRRPFATIAGELRSGRQIRVYTVRLMASIGVAAVVSEVLPLQRSYWVVLTVAIVLKPDFGPVFVRAVQRGAGTVAGAVIGALVLAVLPPGPLLVLPLAAFAALLPYGRSRSFVFFSVFLTPLVVLLIDLLARQGWRLAEARAVDTLVGCAIVLLAGYAPWPGHWHAGLRREFAGAADGVASYLERALLAGPAAPDRQPGPGQLRRQAYRTLSDLRLQFQRAMAEPVSVSKLAAAWWPALVALEQVVDAVTAVAVAAGHGAPLPPPGPVRDLGAALREAAAAVRAGRPAAAGLELAAPGPLAPVAGAVRGVLDALGPAPSGEPVAALSRARRRDG